MNLVAQILPLSNVVIDLDMSSKKRVFEQAGLLFENNHNIARAQVFDSLFSRENSVRRGSVRVSRYRTGVSKD
jgi:PTS system nitrogen regulatory IIA component